MKGARFLLGVGLGAVGVVMAARRLVEEDGPATGLGPDGRIGTAAITGGSSGIGAEFARQLAGQGYDLVLIARRTECLSALAAELTRGFGVKVESLPADLAVSQEVERVATRLADIPSLALLVNNAGFGVTGGFAEGDPARQVDMVHLHVIASIRLARATLTGMLARQHGAIINVASMAAFIPAPGAAIYSATKSSLVTFSQALAYEVRRQGVQVQALCPGFTRSEFHETSEFTEDDRSSIPGPLWLPASYVVAESLASLRHDKVICIPGLGYKLVGVLARNQPTAVLMSLALKVRRCPKHRRRP